MNDTIYTALDIANIVGAVWKRLVEPTTEIETLSYDSRKLTNHGHALFFALSGRRDGHQYLQDVYKTGVRNFVLNKGAFKEELLTDCNLIVVNDTLEALQQLAAHHRSQFHYPVIAITGSNGKTIVKEWLNQLLSPDYDIVRSPKSFNSQLGVPLSLWQMNNRHNLAIIEAGISKEGEMDTLEAMIKPTIGVFTNLGAAHDEGFSSAKSKASEKMSLFKDAEEVIYSADYLDHHFSIPGKKQFSWSVNGTGDLSVLEIHKQGHLMLLKAIYNKQELNLSIPFTDKASIENAVCCCAVMLALGYTAVTIASRMPRLQRVGMRLELKKGLNNCSIIDDSYSNDMSSLTIALDFLRQQKQYPLRTVILSDIAIHEQDANKIYRQLANLMKDKQIDRLLGVGQHLTKYAHLFQLDAQFFNSTEELIQSLEQLELKNTTILIKGARVFGFERISKALTLQTHETTLEINLNALEHNLNSYKNLLTKGTKLMVMVKAFSYGSGSFEIANLLQFNKVDYLTVAYADEGITLRNAGIELPIVVMSPGAETFDQMILHRLEPEIYSFSELKSFIKTVGDKEASKYPIHIKLDTGMHRLGFESEDLQELVSLLKATETVFVKSVFSHLAASGDHKHDDFTRHQIDQFIQFTNIFKERLGYDFIRHIANTSAIVRFPEAQLDMVRLGIGLYGVGSDAGNGLFLHPSAQLKTSITQIKHIKVGETIGYNRNGRLDGEGKIATVKIGYADGYNRRLGNGVGKMLINGYEVRTVGDICMDMCMLDITDITAEEGDEVIVIGEHISVESIAKQIDTIPYEVLTGISQRVKRVYYYE
ncbi:MAG TPA: bifunctional UDP-N-acetylmuramoyl-tripeptide:D-alanyl-D-alanine ligase/alanine racemase [Pseudosphingobacterium sp.]|nr:bifunctional UDP-N-acetylmuramoyl-tripeptide:D-alanyl-D-alanine ligase/alanine racemase [Pseudosphingobacterium sp.]